MRLALHVHYLLYLKRASDTQNWIPEHQGTGDFMRCECVKLVLVSFTLIYTHCEH